MEKIGGLGLSFSTFDAAPIKLDALEIENIFGS